MTVALEIVFSLCSELITSIEPLTDYLVLLNLHSIYIYACSLQSVTLYLSVSVSHFMCFTCDLVLFSQLAWSLLKGEDSCPSLSSL